MSGKEHPRMKSSNSSQNATAASSASTLGYLFDRLAERNPVILFLVAALITFLIHYSSSTYLISGYESDRNTLRNEVSAIIAKNRQAEAVMSNEAQYNREYAEAYRISEDARQMLPTRETISAVMEGVKDLATTNGLKVTRFSAQQAPVASTFASSSIPPQQQQQPPQQGQPAAQQQPTTPAQPSAAASQPPAQSAPNKLFEVSVKAQVRGTHEAVMKFFAALATHERIIQIRTFAINSSGREEVVDLELSTFFAPPPDNLPPIPEAVKQLAATL